MSSRPLACWICGNAINLDNCKIDERDLPVHEQCYLVHIALKSNLPVCTQSRSTTDSLVVGGLTLVKHATFRMEIAESDVKKTEAMISKTSWAIRRSKELIAETDRLLNQRQSGLSMTD